ncbi:hypothetical protein KL933_001190 [Ogataea haglerorum]|uniref:Uncharacterized protein n=1 Tax=Ogataea haglerorum TaxID=1937702 RepID=A0AAN6D9P7_9ASCO|nr:hypothetical protein KL933_001190 [Ogataea haglerorum]KAG7792595.1 hypothetical protein KL910_000835 [Ogataea haglerorum]KAG7792991.1 hypothetical protein KL945_000096 [Ogataea haglerorum]
MLPSDNLDAKFQACECAGSTARHYSQMLGNKFRPGPEHATEQAGYDTNKRCSAGITARLPKLSETPYRGEPTLSRGRQWGRTKRGLEIV